MTLGSNKAKEKTDGIRTMEDFAAHVGLSRPTVSKYFNDPASVREKTRKRIEKAITDSGFRPNLFAVNLKRQRTKILGVIIPNAIDPFYMELTRRIEEIATDAGYFAIVLSSNGRPDLEAEAIERFESMNVAGAIVAPLGQSRGQSKLDSLASRVPLIYVDAPGQEGMPYIGTDNSQSMGLIVDYLCRSGTPPCFLGMPEVNLNARQRRRAYEEAMDRAGQEPRVLPSDPVDSWDFEAVAHRQMAKALAAGLPYSTLLCANDRLAFGALLAAWEAGIKVGRDPGSRLRIAGHDDHPLARYACPPLTTVAQDYAEIARLATNRLLVMLDDKAPATTAEATSDAILLKASIMLRASA
ncbi:LacI family DNA-binding transcriptional regulator [Paracoccus fistulariae]|uniref:LacI family DNA-binding transcriptional regulator n=1 Tax=Paracoccus fistulariae TaxID=658446 RepID=A0ABY7SFW7_9RHOB|nr:LacI family DNA-binding transcriptional regulator [Paracoccus fistulariae]MDB6181796.1 LacI family DNA-binding transcriptional regulator [Paracoccus fistulariae]WCR05912.1 LacI family DNA-binding transcriptional regulator [Paracoccus fistulariae]